MFLASRKKADFVRNGLVSGKLKQFSHQSSYLASVNILEVFLRVLEYYAGVLFLTTNRISDFDEAFTSRIHISLYYPQLQLEPTKEIFRLNFRLIQKRFARKARRICIDQDDILKAVEEYWMTHDKERWNGRQIRNACQTALALAEFDAQGGSYEQVLDQNAEVRLQVEHMMTVSTAYLGFMEYLSKVRDKDDERWAKAQLLRAMERDLEQGGRQPHMQPASIPTPINRDSPSDSSVLRSPFAASSAPPGGQYQQPGVPSSQAQTSPQAGGMYLPYQWPSPYPWPAAGYPLMPPPPGAPGFPPPASAMPGVAGSPQTARQGWAGQPQASVSPWMGSGYGGGYGSQPPTT